MKPLRRLIQDHPEKAEKFISRIETFGLLITVTAIILVTQKFSFGKILLTFGIVVLQFSYLILALFSRDVFHIENKRFTNELTISYILGLIPTLSGIMFVLQGWKDSSTLLGIGCTVTGVMFIYFVYKMHFGTVDEDRHRIIINNLIVRMLPVLLVAAVLIALYLKS